MKVKRIDLENEKDIVTNMIVHTKFLKQIAAIYKPELFKNNFSKIIAAWCLMYYEKYEKAPKSYIQDIYNAEKINLHEELTEIISIYLQNLSDRYEETDENYNVDYEIDKAQKYFRLIEIENLKSNLENAILQNKIDEAEAFVAKFKRIEKAQTAGLDVFSNEAINKLYEEKGNTFLKFPGIIGEALGDMNRGDLIAVAAPAKRGKTWWLQEIGILGMMNKLKVLFVSLEMPEEQMLRRIYQRLLGASSFEFTDSKVRKVMISKFDDDNNVYNDECILKSIYDYDLQKKLKAYKTMFNENSFRLICVPIRSIKASDLSSILDNLEYYEKFIPDIVIADYADIFAPENNKDRRNQIDETWTYLRNIAHERHILVVTGSHSNKTTFKKDINQGDISEDIRKLNHVAMMFALNKVKIKNKKEDFNNLIKISVLANRNNRMTSKKIIVLQQLDIGRPMLDYRWEHETKLKTEEEDD